MATQYEIRLYSAAGLLQAIIENFAKLSYALAVNTVGSLTLTIDDRYYRYMERDARIEVYRTYTGGRPYLEGPTVWFVRYFERDLDADGNPSLTITAYDAKYLLTGRHVMYAAGSSQAKKTAALDDMMKAIVRENLGSSASGKRNISSLLAIQGNLTLAPSITASFAYKPVLDTLQTLAQLSFTNGTYLAFDIVANGPAPNNALEFRTYVNQRGVDHSYPNGKPPLLIDPGLANLTEVVRSTDYRDEVSMVYAGGQGEESNRVIQSAGDASRETGPFSYREKFIDARNSSDANGVLSEAAAELRASRVKRSFSATLLETDGLIYGKHYGLGDVLTPQYQGEAITCRLDAVLVDVDNGEEKITAKLQSDT